MHKDTNRIFFSYGRNKYEVLSISALADSYAYPKHILENFKNGQCSYLGPIIDEAQECIVNRNLTIPL